MAEPAVTDYSQIVWTTTAKAAYGPCFLCNGTDDIVAFFVGRLSPSGGWANVCRVCREAAEVIAQLMVNPK